MSLISDKIFPKAKELIDSGRCPFCEKLIGDFRDELSRKEYKISWLCQSCQDDVFGGP